MPDLNEENRTVAEQDQAIRYFSRHVASFSFDSSSHFALFSFMLQFPRGKYFDLTSAGS